MSERELPSWIDGFMDYTDNYPSAVLFRQWAGIYIMAAALERRVWLNTGYPRPLFPTMYIILCGPPGVGKTVLTSTVHQFLSSLRTPGNENSLHIAPSSVTGASLMDALRAASRNIVRFDDPTVVGGMYSYNSLAVVSGELSVMLPEYENTMMSKLTDIYDGEPYGEMRRTKDLNFKIENPQINMIAGTTPAYLTSMLPEGAWDQGFLARTMLVYSGETFITDLFSSTLKSAPLNAKLTSDLARIYSLFGEMKVTEEAKHEMQLWHKAGGPPIPDHPRLTNYKTRRTMHALKLSMLVSVSEGDDLVITRDHFEKARFLLLEMETALPDIFKAMVLNGDSKAMEECWHYCYLFFLKTQKPIPEHQVMDFLRARVPAHAVQKIIEVMEKAKLLTPKYVEGQQCYMPKARA